MKKFHVSPRARHGGRKSPRRVAPRRENKKSGSATMAKFGRARRIYNRARGSRVYRGARRVSGFGGGKIMHGFLPAGLPKDIAAGIGMAVVAQILAAKFAPQFAQYAQPVGGFVGGGIPGAIAPYALNMLNGVGGSTSGGTY